MKKSKKISIALCSVILMGICSFGIVYAISGDFTHIPYNKIPGGGHCKVAINYGNTKNTTGKTASFKIDSGNFLPVNTRLVFGNQNLASDSVSSVGDKHYVLLANEYNGVIKGGTYYNKTCTHLFEGSNTSSPEVWFSADNLR